MIWYANPPGHSSDGWWAATLHTLAHPHEPRALLSPADRDMLLDDAYAALRAGDFTAIQKMIERAGEGALVDAACLNLLGVVCESRRQWKHAKRFYGRAMRADHRFAPAQENMRRLYELDTFGHSTIPVAVGDATTDLFLTRLVTRRGN